MANEAWRTKWSTLQPILRLLVKFQGGMKQGGRQDGDKGAVAGQAASPRTFSPILMGPNSTRSPFGPPEFYGNLAEDFGPTGLGWRRVGISVNALRMAGRSSEIRCLKNPLDL